MSDLGIWVSFEQIYFASVSYSIIQTRVTTQEQCAIDLLRQAFELQRHLLVEVRGLRNYADFFLVSRVPLQFRSRNVGRAFGKFFDYQFPRGIALQPLIPDHADINFASGDILLGNRMCLGLTVNEFDA